MNRARRADEKNGIFFKLPSLLQELWSLQCRKWFIFLYFLLTTAKI